MVENKEQVLNVLKKLGNYLIKKRTPSNLYVNGSIYELFMFKCGSNETEAHYEKVNYPYSQVYEIKDNYFKESVLLF